MITVSIIMPAYNAGYYIKEAIESVVNQTFKDWELIIIDNNSEDNTRSIISNFRDSRIHYLEINNHGSIAKSRNYGIKNSIGKYIAFLDADDYWSVDKLNKCINRMGVGKYSLVAHHLSIVGNKSGEIISGPENSTTFNDILYKRNCYTPSAVILNRKIIEDAGYFDERDQLITAEDYHLWIKIAYMRPKVAIINEKLGYYRSHDLNHSGKIEKHMNANLFVLEDCHNVYSNSNIQKFYKIIRKAKIYYGAGRAYYIKDDFIISIKVLMRSLMYNPLNIKVYITILLSVMKIFYKK